jgi:hypothetical protein
MPVWTLVYVWAYPPLALLTLLAAWRWGGRSERTIGFLYAIGTLIEFASQTRYDTFEPIIAAVDWSLFGLVTAVAVRDRHLWLSASAAALLLGNLGHMAKLSDPTLPKLAYAILIGSAGYPVLILLAIGIIAHKRRPVRPTPRFSLKFSRGFRSPPPWRRRMH